jgi:murein DD-endopeptidase MepM/ murein hydrolase activator NlpD
VPIHVKPKNPTPPVPPPPGPPVVPPSPPAPSPSGLGSFGNASIDQWDSAFLAAVAAVKAKKGVSVNPLVMKAMMDVESGGDGNYPASKCRSDGSCGPIQIKPQYHQWRCPDCDFKTVPGQIELATHIIGDAMKGQRVDEYGAITSVYFPSDDVINGTTQGQYVQKVRSLVATMSGTTPAPSPPPSPQGDVLDLLFGGKPYDITATYGQLVTWSCPGCYDYFTAYGLDSAHHWAYDASARAGDGAPLYAPFDGKVVCAGTGIGPGAWGTGCAAFPRDNNYGGKPAGVGAGRLELLHADGTRSLILGHVLSSRVHPGDLVTLGDLIGQQGGMNASHVHIEGRYANGTRIGNPRLLFSGGPSPAIYADAVEVPQPDDDPPYVTVKAIRQTKVLQRANPAAPEILEPLQPGTEFNAQHKLIGADGRWYWVGRLRGRVAEADTEVVEVVTA